MANQASILDFLCPAFFEQPEILMESGMPFDLICVACLFAGLFSLFRFAVRLEFFDRPLVLAMCWSVFFPHPANLCIAVFYELIWLDLIFVGTYIPPQAGLVTLVSLALVTGLELFSPARIGLLLFLVLPFAYLASFLERRQRKWQNKELTNLLHAVRSRNTRDFQPGMVIARSLVTQFASSICVLLVSLYMCAAVFRFVETTMSFHPPLTWPMLWLAVSLAAVLSIRISRGCVYVVLVTVVCAGAAFWISDC